MPRLLVLAVPALFVLLAGAGLAARWLGGFSPAEGGRAFALWALETLGVVGLYCLVRGDRRHTPSLWDGVLVAWGAWIFRAPLLLLALDSAGARPAGAWRSCALLLGAYTGGGAALAAIDRWLDRRREEGRS